MKKRITVLALCMLCAADLIAGCSLNNRTEKHAYERLNDYAHAIGYDFRTPEKIYPFMTEDFKSQMSEEEFVEAFNKERSYPYLTGLYFYDPVITEMDENGTHGKAVYTQAARLIGMTYEVEFIYENHDYYIIDWAEFLDGSYLDKFEDCPYTLDWYFDPDNCTK